MIAPRSRKVTIWSQTHWKSAEQRLEQLESIMRKSGAVVLRGGDYDRWDLEVRGGMLGTARLQLLLEEHGEGRQLVRLRIWPTVLPTAPVLAALFALLAMFAVMDLSWITWGLLDAAALALMARTFYESGTASAVMANAIPAAIAEGETIVRAGDTGLQLSQDERTGNKR